MQAIQLLSKWRKASAGDPFFRGEIGQYYRRVMFEKKEKMSEIDFHPVQTSRQREGGKINSAVTLRAYEVYKHLFGEQKALITGSCRGGFGTGELIAFLYARTFPKEEWDRRVNEAITGIKNLG